VWRRLSDGVGGWASNANNTVEGSEFCLGLGVPGTKTKGGLHLGSDKREDVPSKTRLGNGCQEGFLRLGIAKNLEICGDGEEGRDLSLHH